MVFALFGFIALALALVGLVAIVSCGHGSLARDRCADGAWRDTGGVVRLMLACRRTSRGRAARRRHCEPRTQRDGSAIAVRRQRRRFADLGVGRHALCPAHPLLELSAGTPRRAHRSSIGAAARVKRPRPATPKQRCLEVASQSQTPAHSAIDTPTTRHGRTFACLKSDWLSAISRGGFDSPRFEHDELAALPIAFGR